MATVQLDKWFQVCSREVAADQWTGKIAASEFDIKKFKRESISHVGFGYVIRLGELQIGLEFRSHNH